ncbi:SMI1/KNR4 family protein [Pseudomonas sp. B22129]|uniref:SMI1/KNR4 family protein n=1 Tax=Pseudomonas sp. B22129 TaxID=3235111 RepID=UPI003783F7BF
MQDFQVFIGNKKTEGVLSGLAVVDDLTLQALRKGQEKLPEDYIWFLKHVGCGELEAAGFMLYNGILGAEDVFDADTADSLKGILIFGDDMQGSCIGFDIINDWIVVKIDSSDMSREASYDTFSSFMCHLLGKGG